jgi:ATP-dependent Zn protease
MGNLDGTAYHEAGHAVVSWALGVQFDAVSIVPDNDTRGRVTCGNWFDPDDYDNADLVERHLVVTWAGPLAESIHTGTEMEPEGTDRDTLVDLALHVAGPDTTGYLMALRQRTRDALRAHWEAVTAVATALLERQTLAAAEIAALCGAIED